MSWTEWKNMPSPETCRKIDPLSEIGVYQIRNVATNEFIQFGRSIHLKKRLKSLFPKPYGTGKRNNEKKRVYILSNWINLQYRILPTETREDSIREENAIKAKKNHRFNT